MLLRHPRRRPGTSIGRPRTKFDTTPNAFTFVDQTGAARNVPITSAPVVVSGFDKYVPISISGATGEYSINGGAFRSTPYSVKTGDSVRARLTTLNAAGPRTVTVTIGGVSDVFSVTSV